MLHIKTPITSPTANTQKIIRARDMVIVQKRKCNCVVVVFWSVKTMINSIKTIPMMSLAFIRNRLSRFTSYIRLNTAKYQDNTYIYKSPEIKGIVHALFMRKP